MSLASGNPGLAFGVRIIENPMLTVGPFEDWSQVRSHGRAARRRRKGHKQRIRLYYKPDPNMMRLPDGTIVGHPATVHRLREMIDRQNHGSNA